MAVNRRMSPVVPGNCGIGKSCDVTATLGREGADGP